MSKIVAVATAGLFGAAVAVVPGLAGAQSPGAHVTAADYLFNGDGTTPAALTVAPGTPVTFAYPAGYSQHDVHFSGRGAGRVHGQQRAGRRRADAGRPGLERDVQLHGSGHLRLLLRRPPRDDRHDHRRAGDHDTADRLDPASPERAQRPDRTERPRSRRPRRAPRRRADLKASAVQHGTTVRAAVTIARGGSPLTARLLGPATLGRLSRRGVKAGSFTVSVVLGAPARRMLRARRQLRVMLAVTVVGPGGPTTTLKRAVLVKA